MELYLNMFKTSLKKKRVKSRFFSFMLMFSVVMFVIINYVKYNDYRKINILVDSILADIKKEKDYKKQLENQIKFYDNDSYIEKTAREKLGLVKSDEIIFCQEDNNNIIIIKNNLKEN